MNERRQICTFYVDEHFFGVPVDAVQEVILSPDVTRVPLAHPAVHGLVNLRGQLLTTIDLRRRLQLRGSDSKKSQVILVLWNDDAAVALLVDRMGEVLELDQNSFEAPPETLEPTIERLIRGVYKLQGRLLMMLDTQNAVDVTSDSDAVN